MASYHWYLATVLVAIPLAGCRDSLNCEDKGGVEKNGSCTCGAGTRPDETAEHCVPENDGGHEVPGGRDAGAPGVDEDSGKFESTRLDGSTLPTGALSHDVGTARESPGLSEFDGSLGGVIADSGVESPEKACPPGACPGGTCQSGNGDYSCICSEGYTGTGSRSCTDIDECGPALAIGADCSLDFPCVNLSGGYTCLGRFADWPVVGQGTGVEPSYSGDDNVLSDDVTGLSWQSKLPAVYQGCSGKNPSSSFQSSPVELPAGTTCAWSEADRYCAALDFGGYSDWRLPSIVEFATLLGSPLLPALSPTEFSPQFWSSVRWVANAGEERMAVDHAIGFNPNSLESHLYVRCVRGVGKNAATTKHYSLTRDGSEVFDQRTKLSWQRQVPPDMFTLTEARAHCAAAGARIPTLNEWMTTLDAQAFLSESAPAFDSTAFPQETPEKEAKFWSDFVDETTPPSTSGSAQSTVLLWAPYNTPPFSAGGPDTRHYVRCVH